MTILRMIALHTISYIYILREVGTKWMLLANISVSTKHRFTKWEIN